MTPQIIEALVEAIGLKDMSTAAHTWRVALYTRALAEEAGQSHEVIHRLTHAAALHDVGKLDVPSAVLAKPGPLTPEERAVMQTHTTLGHELLTRLGETDPLVLDLVRHHHERWDGQGYPDRIAGESINTAARFFSVIDSFDAMTSIRPYRADVGEKAAEKAVTELEAGAGTRYWPRAVEMFAALYRRGSLGWILDYFNDRCELPAYAAGREDSVVRTARPQPVVLVKTPPAPRPAEARPDR